MASVSVPLDDVEDAPCLNHLKPRELRSQRFRCHHDPIPHPREAPGLSGQGHPAARSNLRPS
eukprot:9489428-Pyramimonas_sp.AAC.1